MDKFKDKPRIPTSRYMDVSLVKMTLLAMLGLSLTACNVTTGTADLTREGIGYRQARFAEMSAMKTWRDCRDRALKLDKIARNAGSSSQYLASAKALQSCETAAGPEIANLNKEERMRAVAIGSLNFLKGGNIEKARSSFENFKNHFGGHDLLFADGSSFIETMAMLLSLSDPASIGMLSMANVNPTLKAELRRVRYWERH